MPLRDHFRPPLDSLLLWDGFRATWPVMIVARLRRQLSHRYLILPRVNPDSGGNIREETAVWAPPQPTLTIATDLPAQDVTEVRVYDESSGRRLVAAVEIVSPANKDRAEHRRAFVSKCVGLLQELVSIVVVDVVTTRAANLYGELLDAIGLADPSLSRDGPSPYAAACRATKPAEKWLLETWTYPLAIGRACRRCPCGWPTISPCRSNWKRVTRKVRPAGRVVKQLRLETPTRRVSEGGAALADASGWCIFPPTTPRRKRSLRPAVGTLPRVRGTIECRAPTRSPTPAAIAHRRRTNRRAPPQSLP